MLEVINILWERAIIKFKLNKKIKQDVYLVCNNKRIKLNTINDEIHLPITNTPEGSMLDEGKWFLELNNEKLQINLEILKEFEDLSRIFKYKDNYSLEVSFDINNNKTLVINVNYMRKNYKYKKLFRIIEGKNLKQKFFMFIKIIAIKIVGFFYKIISNINFQNKVLFLTENSDKLTGNLKDVYNELKNEYPVIVYTNNIYKNKNIFKLLKEIIYISKAKYIFLDNYTSLLNIINLKRNQKTIQLWHAGIGFKSVGYARFGKKGGPHPFYSSHRKYDYIIVDNEEMINVYNEVFSNKKANFIPCGIPRLNKYLNKEIITVTTNELFDKYPLLKNKKIILFAPTFRGSGHENAHYNLNNIDLEKVNNFCKENDFIFIIKLHPFVKKINIDIKKFNNIIELASENINDLIYISDILITDYSSCAYEFSLFNRPLIFYRYDKLIYEYERLVNSIDIFSKEQYEVYNTEELLKTLNKLKGVDIKKRYSNIKSYKNNSIKSIKEIIDGE